MSLSPLPALPIKKELSFFGFVGFIKLVPWSIENLPCISFRKSLLLMPALVIYNNVLSKLVRWSAKRQPNDFTIAISPCFQEFYALGRALSLHSLPKSRKI